MGSFFVTVLAEKGDSDQRYICRISNFEFDSECLRRWRRTWSAPRLRRPIRRIGKPEEMAARPGKDAASLKPLDALDAPIFEPTPMVATILMVVTAHKIMLL